MMFAHIHSTKEKLYGLFNLHVQLDFTIGDRLSFINTTNFVKADFYKTPKKFIEPKKKK